jgi:hypothetical protein
MAEDTIQTQRQRSAAYPSYLISECFDFVKSIYSSFGSSTYVSREQIAKILGKSASTILMKLSSSNQYGLIEMKKNDGYKPSDLFLRMYKPLNDNEKRSAELECLRSPTLYQSLVGEFSNGKLPNTVGLAVILFRKYGIAEAVSEKAAEIFIENVKALNLISSEGMLSLSAGTSTANDSKQTNDETSEQEQVKTFTAEKNEQKQPAPGQHSFAIALKGRRKATLTIPDDMTQEDFETIKRWIDLTKESYE